MVGNAASQGFGGYLKSLRLEQGLGIEEIARRTKISKSCIVLIEREDHKELPAKVFVKGFLRNYAQALGTSPEKIIRLYEQGLERVESIDKEATHLASDMSPRARALVCLALMLVNILGTIFIYQRMRHQALENEKVVSAPGDQQTPLEGNSAADQQTPAPIVAKSNNFVLKATALKAAWIKIAIDNRPVQVYRLKPRDRLEIEAQDSINMLIGDAGSISMVMNNKPVEIPGKDGEMISLQLP